MMIVTKIHNLLKKYRQNHPKSKTKLKRNRLHRNRKILKKLKKLMSQSLRFRHLSSNNNLKRKNSLK